jgi:hypothetical protein
MKYALAGMIFLLVASVCAVLIVPERANSQSGSSSFIALGAAAHGNSAITWFIEPSTRRVFFCTAGATGTGCGEEKLPK